jgi:RNA polymerase sigma factor (sigma-70 family)
MTTTTANVIAHLQHWLTRSAPNPATDATLVRRFVKERDEAAFAALVDRHGPMVLGVARRVVGDHHTAEDVFQATFLVLARRARHLRHPAALPAWLHHTAHNLALTALRARKRRERAEAEARNRVTGDPLEDLSTRELLTILDEELRRLPETFRLPLILCCLEGRSQEEAATLLAWTPGSVKGRLERGRQRLKDRLARRGLTFAIGAGVSLLVVRPALAGLLRQATLQAVRAGESVSPVVAELANSVTKPLFAASGKTILVVAAVGLIGVGVGLALSGSPEPKAGPPAAEDPPASPRAGLAADPLPEGAVARLGSSPLRIGNSAFALTPDAKTIVTVSPEGIVRNFDANTGRLLERRQLTERSDVHATGQPYARLSADGKTVALDEGSTGGRRVTVWDVPSGKILFRRTPEQGKGFGGYAVSPDGKQLALDERTDGPQGTQTLRVYDLETKRGKELGSLEFNVYDVRFTTDGKRVFVSQTSSETGDQTFACFDVPAGKQLWRLPRKGMEFAITPDGKKLVSAIHKGGEAGYQIIETDPDSGKPTESYQPGIEPHPNVRLVIAPDNRTVVMNHFDAIIVWDLQTGNEVRRFKPSRGNGRGYGPELGAMSPDSRTLVTNLGLLQRWDLTTGKPMFDAPPDDGLGAPIERLAFTADGKELFASSWYLNSGRWDVATGKQVSFTRDRFGHQLVSTPEGLRVLNVDSYKSPYEATLIDPVAGKPIQTVRWAEPREVGINGLRCYTLTANGKTLLIAHGDEPGEKTKSYVTACDVASGRRLAHFTVPGIYSYPRPPFSPCGRWVVLGGKVYHVATGTELFTPAGEPGERLMPENRMAKAPVWFSEDGRLMAGRLLRKVGDKPAVADTLAVWELASGKVLARFPKAEFVAEMAFAPDGRTVALLDGWGVRLHDTWTGEKRTAYPAPDVTCEVTDRGCGSQTLVFAPDGRTLATGHRDGAILLWKVPQPAGDGPKAVTEAERETLWADLGSDSPEKARAAVERLARHPAEATALLTARFRPVPVPADPALAALAKDLDSDVFATREEASRKLREYGTKAERALRRELAAAPSPERKRRLEGILEAIGSPLLRLPLTGDALRGVRAIEVLERVATPEARTLLQAWAEQGRDEQLAAEARVVLERTSGK